MTSLTDPLDAARSALQPGEHLVWADRPDPRVLARARLAQQVRGVLGLLVIAAFLWLSFLPNWPGGWRGLGLGAFLAAATLYSLWLLAAPLVARRAAGRTVYAVTDRRLLVLEDWPVRRRRAFAPAELDEPEIIDGVLPAAPALGSVVFIHHKLPWWQRSAGGGYRIEAFFGVADAPRVADEIAKLKAGATGALPEEDA